jgi:hypothetical protein
MSQYAKQAAAAGDKFLSALATTQDNVIRYLAASRPGPATSHPAASAALKTTQAFSNASFDFSLRLLGQQHAFLAKLYALQPSAVGVASRVASAPKAPAAKKARRKKAASKRRTTKKSAAAAAAPTP